jgi:hypothetical protein
MNIRDALSGHLPPAALERAVAWFEGKTVRLAVTKSRVTKWGDFMPRRDHQPPRITVNGTLNPYAFLITLIHEMAHFEVYAARPAFTFGFARHSKKGTPHGASWKEAFRSLMDPYLTPDIFPADLLIPLRKHLVDPAASTFSDIILGRALAKYDNEEEGIYLELLPAGALFSIPSGKIFRKGERRRTRYLCTDTQTRRRYLFSPLSKVRLAKPVQISLQL